MSRPLVCDASALVALLLDDGPDGRWVATRLAGSVLHAPALVHFETANIIRRTELAGLVGVDQAAQAHADLLDLSMTQWPYEVIAERAWQLRYNLTSYDASYVTVAELIEAPLVTLDLRISRVPQLRCPVAVPGP